MMKENQNNLDLFATKIQLMLRELWMTKMARMDFLYAKLLKVMRERRRSESRQKDLRSL
jgi:hypothetical protein